MKRKNMFSVVVIAIAIILLPISYSIYTNQSQVSIVTTTGDIVCNLSVDTSDTYIENNEAYFLVTVDNFKTINGKTVVTAMDIDYTLTIENNGGATGLFRYIDDDGNTNTNGEENLTIERRIGKSKNSQQFKVFVTADTNLKTKVDFKVRLDAHQANMD